ncbi:MAG: hypothetical protein V4687_16810 [Bacteroidota bacterium]
MKNILFGLIILLTCQTVKAQKVMSNDKVTFSVPQQARDISGHGSVRSKEGNPDFVIAKAKNKINRQLLEIGDMTLSVRVIDFVTGEKYLENLRGSFFFDAQLASHRKYLISELSALNNFKYLVIRYESPDDPSVYTLFYAINNARTKMLKGAAEFPKTTRANSQQAFMNFLRTVKFK